MKKAQGLVRDIPDGPVSLFWRRVEASGVFATSSVILCYMSIPGEVPTDKVIARWAEDKVVVLPVVRGESLELRRYSPGKLTCGYRGVIEPSEEAELVSPSDIDLALVPGVAFCLRGGRVLRLGRGGGYYDRLLPLLDCHKTGVCFDYRVIRDIPADPWDATLDDLAVCSL